MATNRRMSEHDWLKCRNPSTMLSFLGKQLSERKRRLFACACCRAARGLLDDQIRNAVLVAECFADGTATRAELDDAMQAGSEDHWDADGQAGELAVRAAVRCAITDQKELWQLDFVWADVAVALQLSVNEGDDVADWYDSLALEWDLDRGLDNVAEGCETNFAPLLRDIVGNPFRRVAFDERWLTSDVVALARGVYAERAFDRMPILADALQDAGCNDHEILSHCRNTDREHVRGCWLIDRVLGKS